MRDDIALFHVKQNQRNSFSLSVSLLFVCLLPNFSSYFWFCSSESFFPLPSPVLFVSFNLICLRGHGYCCDANNLRYDDKTIWIMFIQLTIARWFVYFCVCTYIFFFTQLNVFFVPDRSVFKQAYLLGFFQYNVHQKMSFDQSQTIFFLLSFWCSAIFEKCVCLARLPFGWCVYNAYACWFIFNFCCKIFLFLRLCQLLLVNKYLMSSKHIKWFNPRVWREKLKSNRTNEKTSIPTKA